MARRDGEETRIGETSPTLSLVVAALLLLVVFQTIELVRNHQALHALRDSQEAPVQEALKIRHQLDTIAGKTAELAADGDTDASAIVKDLQRQGITLSPPKQ